MPSSVFTVVLQPYVELLSRTDSPTKTTLYSPGNISANPEVPGFTLSLSRIW